MRSRCLDTTTDSNFFRYFGMMYYGWGSSSFYTQVTFKLNDIPRLISAFLMKRTPPESFWLLTLRTMCAEILERMYSGIPQSSRPTSRAHSRLLRYYAQFLSIRLWRSLRLYSFHYEESTCWNRSVAGGGKIRSSVLICLSSSVYRTVGLCEPQLPIYRITKNYCTETSICTFTYINSKYWNGKVK